MGAKRMTIVTTTGMLASPRETGEKEGVMCWEAGLGACIGRRQGREQEGGEQGNSLLIATKQEEERVSTTNRKMCLQGEQERSGMKGGLSQERTASSGGESGHACLCGSFSLGDTPRWRTDGGKLR